MFKPFILLSIFICSIPYVLTNTKISDLGVMKEREQKEYYFVMEQKRGGITVFNKKIDGNKQDDFRLPLKYENDDKRLYEMLERIEGDNAFWTLYKGVTKGVATSIGLGHFGGGSTLITSASGSLLGQRVPPHDAEIWQTTWQRLKEWIVTGYIDSLPEPQKRKLVLNEVCAFERYVGCTLVSARAFGRAPQNDVERLFLAATVRYSGGNRDRILDYMKSVCRSPQIMKRFQFGDCDELEGFINSLQYREVDITGRLANKINLASEKGIDLLSIVSLAEQMRVYNPNKVLIEVSAREWESNVGSKSLFIVSNNEFLLKNNGFNDENAASVSKLLILLSEAPFGEQTIDAMRTSDNAAIKKTFSEREGEIIREIISLGIINMKQNVNVNAHRASYGLLNISSGNIHVMLNEVAQKQQHKRIATAALFGTLSDIRKKFIGMNVLVAKSGTDASRENSGRPNGVYGSLIVFYVEKDKRKFSVVIRMHAASSRRPICIRKRKLSCSRTLKT